MSLWDNSTHIQAQPQIWPLRTVRHQGNMNFCCIVAFSTTDKSVFSIFAYEDLYIINSENYFFQQFCYLVLGLKVYNICGRGLFKINYGFFPFVALMANYLLSLGLQTQRSSARWTDDFKRIRWISMAEERDLWFNMEDAVQQWADDDDRDSISIPAGPNVPLELYHQQYNWD